MEVFEAIAKLSFESNVQEGKEAVEVLSKQENIINDLTAQQKELSTEIEKAGKANSKTVKALSEDYKQVEKTIKQTQKVVQDEIKKSAATIENALGSIDFGRFKNLFTGNEFAKLDEQIIEASNDMQQLAIVTDALKAKLNNLDPQSSDFAELNAVIEVSEAALKEYATAAELVGKGNIDLSATFEDVYGDIQPLNTRIGELEDRMYELALAGEKNTDEYKALESELIKYKRAIRDVDEGVDAAVETSKGLRFVAEATQAVAAGFQLGAGAAALFGVEQEQLEQAQTKLLAVMSLANGLEQISTLLKKESVLATTGQALASKAATAAQSAYTFVVGASTGALKAFKIALATTGIGLIIVAIGALVANWEKLTDSVQDSSNALEKNKEILEATDKAISNAVQAVTELEVKVDLARKGIIKKEEAVKFYNDTIGKTTGEIKSLDEAEQFLVKNAEAFIKVQILKAQATELIRLAAEQSNKALLEGQKNAFSFQTSFERLSSVQGLSTLFGFAPTQSELEERRKNSQEVFTNEAENYKNLAAQLFKEIAELNKANNFNPKVTASLDVNKTTKNIKDDAKKATDDANKTPPKLNVKINFDNDGETFPQQVERLRKEAQERLEKLFADKKFREQVIEFEEPQNDSGFDPVQFKKDQEEKRRLEELEKKKKEQREKDKQRLQQAEQETAQAANQIIDIELNKLNKLEQMQTERLAKAKEEAGEASDVSVKAETDRLDKIREEREKFAQAQRAIDAAIIISNQAVTVSEAIKGLTKAAAEGGGIASGFTVAAYVASIIAGTVATLAAIRSVNQPTFYEGGYTGDGNPHEVSTKLGRKPYEYHKGEFVMNNHLTKSYRDMFEGIHSNDLSIHRGANGTYTLVPKTIDVNQIAKDHTIVKMFYSGHAERNDETSGQLKEIKELLKQRELTVNNNFDAEGFGTSVAFTMAKVNFRNQDR